MSELSLYPIQPHAFKVFSEWLSRGAKGKEHHNTAKLAKRAYTAGKSDIENGPAFPAGNNIVCEVVGDTLVLRVYLSLGEVVPTLGGVGKCTVRQIAKCTRACLQLSVVRTRTDRNQRRIGGGTPCVCGPGVFEGDSRIIICVNPGWSV